MENYLWRDSQNAVHLLGFMKITNICYLKIMDNMIFLSHLPIPGYQAKYKIDISRLIYDDLLSDLLLPDDKLYFSYDSNIEIYSARRIHII